MPPALPGFVRRGDPAEIAHVGTAVSLGIGVDDFPIKTGPKDANVVAVMHYRRGVYDKDDDLALAGFSDPFVTLSPRQLLTPTPFAIYTLKAESLNGPLPDAQLPDAQRGEGDQRVLREASLDEQE